MEKWRKSRGFDTGAFAVGYDAGESRRITRACARGDMPGMTAWYPLVAWDVNRAECEDVCRGAGVSAAKSSCFMCPNMSANEWLGLRDEHPSLFSTAMLIERTARRAGENPQAGRQKATVGYLFDPGIRAAVDAAAAGTLAEGPSEVLNDRCVHGGCFT